MSAECSSANIPTGYKQTEVGVIPEDWQIVLMRSLGKFSKGQGISKDEAVSGEIPCVRYGEIYTHHNDIIRLFNSRISVEVARRSKRLSKGDLLFAGSGETKEEIGKCVAFVGEEEAYAGGDIVIFTPNKGSSRFFGYLFNSPIIAHQKASKGQGDAIVHISSSALSSIRVPLPPTLTEQESIAEALSYTDAFIESLEQLIAKKRQIKQGAMQELLTGKRRLPGFSKEWETKPLGDVAEITMGQSPSSANYNSKGEGLPLIQGNADIFNRKTIKRVFTTEITRRGKCGDIIMSVRAPVGEVSRAEFDICLGRGVCAIRYSNNFLYHTLISKESTWAKLSKGSTFDSVNSADVKAFDIELPTDSAEQEAIATILSDMDAEITALEEKLAKARQIKQGMMQELLTGRTRLV